MQLYRYTFVKESLVLGFIPSWVVTQLRGCYRKHASTMFQKLKTNKKHAFMVQKAFDVEQTFLFPFLFFSFLFISVVAVVGTPLIGQNLPKM